MEELFCAKVVWEQRGEGILGMPRNGDVFGV